jgi:hypothetical protein
MNWLWILLAAVWGATGAYNVIRARSLSEHTPRRWQTPMSASAVRIYGYVMLALAAMGAVIAFT